MMGYRTVCRHAGVAFLLFGIGAGAAGPDATYRIVPEQSELRILVYRAGALAKLGHNHLVVIRDLSGDVVLGQTPADSSFRIEFSVDDLIVDDAVARSEEGPGFEGDVDADDIDGTRRNMLGSKLLDAAEHESIRIESSRIGGEFPNLEVTAGVTVKGTQHELQLPVSVNTFDRGLVAVGRIRISHADIGLRPFQAGLGTLRVADELQLKFRVVATK
jgi:hypothetical protein